jgi:BASS family bile acid:Na+ symporter
MNTIWIVMPILIVLMFLLGIDLNKKAFVDVVRNPKVVLLCLTGQIVVLTVLAFAVAWLLNLPAVYFMGLVLVACCPGGNISNFISSLSKGNVELSVSMTAITTALAPIVTPLNFFAWGNLYAYIVSVKQDIPELSIPFLPMLYQIMLLLGLPIVLGIIFAKYHPNATKKITKPAQVLSILLFIGMVVVSFSQNWQIFLDNIIYVFFIVMLHNACALATGFFGAKLAKLPQKDCRSLTVEIGIQNSGLGLVLLFNPVIFPPEIWHQHYGGMLLVTAWWGIWHIVSGLTVAYLFRRKPLAE